MPNYVVTGPVYGWLARPRRIGDPPVIVRELADATTGDLMAAAELAVEFSRATSVDEDRLLFQRVTDSGPEPTGFGLNGLRALFAPAVAR